MNELLKNLYRNTNPNNPTITDAENIESSTMRSISNKILYSTKCILFYNRTRYSHFSLFFNTMLISNRNFGTCNPGFLFTTIIYNCS